MKLYNDYNSYLKERYGSKVYKISVDAGFTCPNRDGTKGTGGCAYCNKDGSRAPHTSTLVVGVYPAIPVAEQLKSRIKYLKEKNGAAEKFIAYFQAFTNTYAPVGRLKTIYDEVAPFKEIIGISIGTRPDAVDEEKLGLVASYGAKREVWIEYGLQSVHDRTLKSINRGHDFKDFLNAVNLTKKFDIQICVHVILGLPGETREDMIETARRLNELKVNGVKIHLLHILKGSAFEELYRKGLVKVLSQDEYVNLVSDFLENLSPDIIIQRLTGEGRRGDHIAPLWALDKIGTINKIREMLLTRKSFQGIRL